MRLFRRRPAGTDASDFAVHAARYSGTSWITTIGTVVALVFSGLSLWETSLKQADLSVYVTDAIAYTRDPNNDDAAFQAGGYEVIAVPVTIANGGARDAAVLSLRLDVRNPETGETARFGAAYTAGGEYFAPNRGEDSSGRPRTPFAALMVAGRSAWSGTILFYSAGYWKRELVKPKGKVEAILTVVTTPPSGWLDRLLADKPAPVTLALEVPDTARLGTTLTRLRSANAEP